MTPIHELLNRIRWDREYGAGTFEIGYLDHVAHGIVRIPLGRIHFEEGNRLSFQVENNTGETLDIPFHRIREVYRDGVLIWRRPD